jgi:hypothetical protein
MHTAGFWHGIGYRKDIRQTQHTTKTTPMNAFNSLIFTLIGFVMESLPLAFPSWFPPNGADQSSTRALWLGVMGFTQIGLGIGYIVHVHVVPTASRLFSAARATDRGTLVVTSTRGVAGR